MMKDQLTELIIRVAEELNGTMGQRIPVEQGADTPLYGQEGVLDSLELVTMVVAVEEAIEDDLGVMVVLADEKAMSQRTSPFLTIGTLATYAEKLIQEETASAV